MHNKTHLLLFHGNDEYLIKRFIAITITETDSGFEVRQIVLVCVQVIHMHGIWISHISCKYRQNKQRYTKEDGVYNYTRYWQAVSLVELHHVMLE